MKLSVSKDDGTKTEMYHQTPVLRLPFGVGEQEGDYGKKYEATMSFPGYVHSDTAPGNAQFDDPVMQQYHDWLTTWDENNLALATDNTQEWFKKKYSREVIQELYKYQLKDSSDPSKYSKLMRTKVPFRYDAFTCQVYDSNGVSIGIERLTRGSRVIALIKTTGMWFAGKGFGVTHQVEQFMLMEEESFDSCAISSGTVLAETKCYFNNPDKTCDDTEEAPDPESMEPERKRLKGGRAQIACS
jgi:hypothetical protein